MGNGAATKAGAGGLQLEPPCLRDTEVDATARKLRVPPQMVEWTNRRFRSLDSKRQGTIRAQDVASPDDPDAAIKQHIFKYGFGQSNPEPTLAQTSSEFASVLTSFKPNADAATRIAWLFRVISRKQSSFTVEDLEALCKALGIELDEECDLCNLCFDDNDEDVPATQEAFTHYVVSQLKSLPQTISRQLLDIPIPAAAGTPRPGTSRVSKS